MDVPLRWHLGPMEEEEVHPHSAASKHPVPGPGISPVGETSWRGATPGKAVQEAVVSPPHTPTIHTRCLTAFKATLKQFCCIPSRSKPKCGNNHRPQASGTLTAVSQSGKLWFNPTHRKRRANLCKCPSLPQPASEMCNLQVSRECGSTKTMNLPKTL